jgi:hypothetical protein
MAEAENSGRRVGLLDKGGGIFLDGNLDIRKRAG